MLAVDQGTSGTKALVVCWNAASSWQRVRRGAPATCPAAWSRWTRSSYARLGARRRPASAGRAGEDVVTLGLANQGDRPRLGPGHRPPGRPTPLVWQDRRAETVRAELAEHDEG
ncbi:hypothetical protein LT493_26970 [Streptomyces tricolor]|nr:hypothetical protein [Streptomyces tricolor]